MRIITEALARAVAAAYLFHGNTKTAKEALL